MKSFPPGSLGERVGIKISRLECVTSPSEGDRMRGASSKVCLLCSAGVFPLLYPTDLIMLHTTCPIKTRNTVLVETYAMAACFFCCLP